MGSATTGEVTRAIAEFAASRPAPPAHVVERGKIHILDSLGLALAGAASPLSKTLREQLADEGIAGRGATIFGSRLRAPPRFAAAANAAAIHADNFDDTTPQARPDRTGGIHASGAVLPVALSLGEATGAAGTDIVEAYLVGVEVASRLNHAAAPRHYGDGFHATGTLGVFGAAAAAGALMRLEPERLVYAIGIAASRAAGVRRNFGTMAEILHPGNAAESGIAAADLARRGVTAAPDALDGPAGYLAAAGGGCDPDEIAGRLGAPWAFEDPGVWIKPYPCGALTHPGAGLLLELTAAADVAARDIASIRVRTNPRILDTLLGAAPRDAAQARFSMEFVLAVAAVAGRVGPSEFTEATLGRGDVRDMMARVDYAAFDREEDDFTNVTTLIEIETADGRILSGRADHAHGSAKSPFSFEEATEKFNRCAAHGRHPPQKTARIPRLVANLDEPGVPALLFPTLAARPESEAKPDAPASA